MVSLRQRVFQLLMAVVLIASAAAAGAVITYEVQRHVWETRLRDEYQKQMVDKRIELIERTVNLMGKSTAVIGQEKNYTRSFLTAMAATAQDPSKMVGIFKEMFGEPSEARCNIAEVHAEFMSLLELNEIFFEGRTRKAVRALQEADPWWEADSALKDDLIEALKADFYGEESPE